MVTALGTKTHPNQNVGSGACEVPPKRGRGSRRQPERWGGPIQHPRRLPRRRPRPALGPETRVKRRRSGRASSRSPPPWRRQVLARQCVPLRRPERGAGAEVCRTQALCSVVMSQPCPGVRSPKENVARARGWDGDAGDVGAVGPGGHRGHRGPWGA